MFLSKLKMYIIGNTLCEHCNVGGSTHLRTLQCREEGESCNVHLYNANSFCFDWFSVLFIRNFKFPAGVYLMSYTPFSALKLQQTLILAFSDDSLVLSALLFILKKSMPQYIAHIYSLGWFLCHFISSCWRRCDVWWVKTLWSMSVIHVLAGHISFPSWEDSSCMKLWFWQPADANVCHSDYGSPMAGSVLCTVLLLHGQGME